MLYSSTSCSPLDFCTCRCRIKPLSLIFLVHITRKIEQRKKILNIISSFKFFFARSLCLSFSFGFPSKDKSNTTEMPLHSVQVSIIFFSSLHRFQCWNEFSNRKMPFDDIEHEPEHWIERKRNRKKRSNKKTASENVNAEFNYKICFAVLFSTEKHWINVCMVAGEHHLS